MHNIKVPNSVEAIHSINYKFSINEALPLQNYIFGKKQHTYEHIYYDTSKWRITKNLY